jgi:hypothetical protein
MSVPFKKASGNKNELLMVDVEFGPKWNLLHWPVLWPDAVMASAGV